MVLRELLKKHSIFLLCLSIILLCGCSVNSITQLEQNTEIYSDSEVNYESKFVGEWYCSRSNSCNDMDIYLTITQSNNHIYFKRNMISKNGVGSSNLSYDGTLNDDDSIYIDYISGTYVLENNILYEKFDNGRENKYIRND